jgi:hypothetical protein
MSTGWKCVICVLLLLSTCVAQRSTFVSTKGREIITPNGEPILLRGINLGNWLVPEGYMFKFDSATANWSAQMKHANFGRSFATTISRARIFNTLKNSD